MTRRRGATTHEHTPAAGRRRGSGAAAVAPPALDAPECFSEPRVSEILTRGGIYEYHLLMLLKSTL